MDVFDSVPNDLNKSFVADWNHGTSTERYWTEYDCSNTSRNKSRIMPRMKTFSVLVNDLRDRSLSMQDFDEL